jgi:hypothetical protein
VPVRTLKLQYAWHQPGRCPRWALHLHGAHVNVFASTSPCTPHAPARCRHHTHTSPCAAARCPHRPPGCSSPRAQPCATTTSPLSWTLPGATLPLGRTTATAPAYSPRRTQLLHGPRPGSSSTRTSTLRYVVHLPCTALSVGWPALTACHAPCWYRALSALRPAQPCGLPVLSLPVRQSVMQSRAMRAGGGSPPLVAVAHVAPDPRI